MRFPRMTILQKYVLREHLIPFIMGFSVVTFLLTMDFLFDYLDLLIGKGIPVLIVLQLFLYGLGWMVALSIPCAVLVASLMTFGRLTQDNEMTAARAGGVNALSVMIPPFIAAGIIAMLLSLFMNFVLPETNHAFANLMIDISKKRPTVEIREGVFIDDFQGYSMLISKLDDRTGKMSNVTIYDFHSGSVPTTIFAKRGVLSFSRDGNTLTLLLQDGEIHEIPDMTEPRKYRRLMFKTHVINIPNVSSQLLRSERQTRGEREMTIAALKERIRQLSVQEAAVRRSLVPQLHALGYNSYEDFLRQMGGEPGFSGFARRLGAWLLFWKRPSRDSRAGLSELDVPKSVQYTLLELEAIEKQVNSFTVEIHKKFSIPFACLVFVLVGMPLGMKARKSGLAIGFASIGFFVFYYIFLLGGEQLADRKLLPPGIAIWMPNIVLGALGLLLALDVCEVIDLGFLRRARRRRRLHSQSAPGNSESGETKEKEERV
ncbi:MAG: LptF/LptG family permease [Candidatus Eiseniibacteriota bacterium]|nr:MAG: LptF/LptG family permease [Candidatus Eisenbacteria bacterium]